MGAGDVLHVTSFFDFSPKRVLTSAKSLYSVTTIHIFWMWIHESFGLRGQHFSMISGTRLNVFLVKCRILADVSTSGDVSKTNDVMIKVRI